MRFRVNVDLKAAILAGSQSAGPTVVDIDLLALSKEDRELIAASAAFGADPLCPILFDFNVGSSGLRRDGVLDVSSASTPVIIEALRKSKSEAERQGRELGWIK